MARHARPRPRRAAFVAKPGPTKAQELFARIWANPVLKGDIIDFASLVTVRALAQVDRETNHWCLPKIWSAMSAKHADVKARLRLVVDADVSRD